MHQQFLDDVDAYCFVGPRAACALRAHVGNSGERFPTRSLNGDLSDPSPFIFNASMSTSSIETTIDVEGASNTCGSSIYPHTIP